MTMQTALAAFVDGNVMYATVMKGPHTEALTQSGYLTDGSDFAGYVTKSGLSAPYVALATGVKEHWRASAPSNDPGAHAPWRLTTSLAYSGLSGSPVYDPVLSIGYNAAAEGNAIVAGEPSWTTQWEADWHDGNSKKMEHYLQYISAGGGVSYRPYMIQLDRVNHETTVMQYHIGRTTGFSWIKGFEGREEIAVLAEGSFALWARTASTGHDTAQCSLNAAAGKLRGVAFNTLTGTFGVNEVSHPRGLIAFDGVPAGTDTGDNFRLVLNLDNGTGEDVITIARAAGSAITFSRALLGTQLWLDSDPAAPFLKANTGSHSWQLYNKRTVSGQFVVLDVTDAQPVTIVSPTSNGSTKSALVVDTSVTLSSSDTRLLTLKNNTTEKWRVDKDGYITGGGATLTGVNAIGGQVLEIKQDRSSFNTAIKFTDTGAGAAYSISLSGGLEIVKPGVSRIAHFDTAGIEFDSALQLDGNIGFYAHAPAAKPTVTGSRGANAALASLLTGLAGLGLLTDSST